MPMTTRPRRQQLQPSRSTNWLKRGDNADMQLDSDVDMDAEVESLPRRRVSGNTRSSSSPNKARTRRRQQIIEDEEDDEEEEIESVNVADDDEEAEEEDEEGDEDDEVQSSADADADVDVESVAPKASTSTTIPTANSKLKIRLKMPTTGRYETPLVESEDDMDSEYLVMPGGKKPQQKQRPLTSRQAVLANVIDATHVSLDSDKTKGKKEPLNETELALRREETARKRKNLTEKKLEDEKLETINRLLKKQSRPRKKKNGNQRPDMDDIAPAGDNISRSTSMSALNPSGSGPGSRSKKGSNSKKAGGGGGGGGGGEDAEVEGEEDEDGEEEDPGMDVDGDVEDGVVVDEEENLKEVPIPRMYRWISTTRPAPVPAPTLETATLLDITDSVMKMNPMDSEETRQMCITFSVPTCALPVMAPGSGSGSGSDNATTLSADAPAPISTPAAARTPTLPRPTTCAAPGCGKPFRYRLVKNWTRGACGIGCLKALEAGL